jgi:hypothetical protein
MTSGLSEEGMMESVCTVKQRKLGSIAFLFLATERRKDNANTYAGTRRSATLYDNNAASGNEPRCRCSGINIHQVDYNN